jgi:hypothetical protein
MTTKKTSLYEHSGEELFKEIARRLGEHGNNFLL